MADRTFDWKPRFDERSRSFAVRDLLGITTPRTHAWACKPRLDQGQEGACVGFGWAHECGASPHVEQVSNDVGFEIYNKAKTLDDMPGENYDGTSVLAGAKATQSLSRVKAYRWAFSLNDVLLALSYVGPVVIGVNWWTGMMDTTLLGYIKPTGQIEGGHCVCVRGLALGRGYVTIRNSWGSGWGHGGDCKLRFDDLASLLADQGEACVPTKV